MWFSRVVLRVAIVLGIVMGARALSMAPPPPPPEPPEGWEDEVVPGFTPSIESVVVDHGFRTVDEGKKQIEQWGPESTPVLIRLYRDERWVRFQDRVLFLMRCSPDPRVVDFLYERFEALLPASDGDSDSQQRSERSRIASVLVSGDPGRFIGFVDEHDIVPLIADRTEASPEIDRWLEKLGSISIPLTAIFPAGRPSEPIVLRDVYTEADLHRVIEQVVVDAP